MAGSELTWTDVNGAPPRVTEWQRFRRVFWSRGLVRFGTVIIASLGVMAVLTYLALCILAWRAGFRLSLAGVAGLIVTIGFTADSFIVYFERIRDELRDGKSITAAVEDGWSRAKRTIYISKSINILAAVVLYERVAFGEEELAEAESDCGLTEEPVTAAP